MSFTQKRKPKKSLPELHDYQKKSIKKVLANTHHGLFLPTGLGKTVVTLTALEKLIKQNKVGSALVVGTIRTCYNVWPQQIKEWEIGLSHTILHGKGKKNIDTDFDIYLINYEGLPWFYEQVRKDPNLCPDMLVLDESTKIKNSQSKRFKLLRAMRPLFDRIYILTGTPNPNGYMDLWSQIYMLDGGEALGKYITHYRRNYFHKIWLENFALYVIENRSAREAIQKKIKPLVTHIPRSIIPLPPLIERVVNVTLPDSARVIYDSMQEQLVADIRDNKITAANLGVATGKCRQISNGIIFTGEGRKVEYIHDEKIKALKDILEESGEPTVVGYEFVPDGDRIEKSLKGYKVARIKSGTTGEKEIAQWENKKIDVLLVQTASVAHGLNFQYGGSQLVFFGIPWDLEVYQQLIERLHRQGQKKPVIVFFIFAEDTIDQKMVAAIEDKDIEQKGFLKAVLSIAA